ncbi:DUF2218 domain-containing protein [Paracoccus sp. YIM 132242]|uniref:DUF2218 domain-containing protein n=1 Tax=Paracoccus lichenicola TaxID=2665644 RepID=A0A6L6HNK0_9RHOB|nr:DUF2218 domain-containing protein [Paracoccus lichenicola]MTE00737.1 DUF2218 domain-containing protein [Paracoccus lichenicola]
MSIEPGSTGHFATRNAQGYMTQLCKHFAHKIPATVQGNEGLITFEIGQARLVARDGDLQCTVAGADAAAVERLQGIIDSHLARFAFREAFTRMDWQPAA